METHPPDQRDTDKEPIIGLIRGILQDGRILFTKELTAAKLEIAREIGKTVKASLSLAVGVFILSIGVVLLSLMLVFLLVEYAALPIWASLGIVAAVFIVIGVAAILAGKSKVAAAKPFPEETLRSTQQDVRYISERAAGH